MRKYIMALVAAAMVLPVLAQTDDYSWHFERGEALYRSGKYVEAYQEFRKATAHTDSSSRYDARQVDFYMAMSASRAGAGDAVELLEGFLAAYPESVNSAEAVFALANTYFDRGDYAAAVTNYMAMNPLKLDPDTADEYYFKAGYSYFAMGDYDLIYPYMEKVAFPGPYYVHAQYCLGYADYREGKYDSAKEHFMTVMNSEAYSGIIQYYLIQIEFALENYHYVTENGPAALRMAKGDRTLELMRVVGESWFRIHNWKTAIQHLDQYRTLGGRMGRDENYMLGFAYYMSKDYKQAEAFLSKVPGADDPMSQNASYHLGDVYLKLGNKQRAMQSFSIAGLPGFDSAISEDALFNYGKLQYELGGGYFNEAINVMNRYLALYPSSRRAPQVREYLAAAYYNSRNYEAAYQWLAEIPNPDNNMRAAIQKITYFRALEYYTAGDYAKAGEMLAQSLANRYNAKYTALAGYWQGEVLFREGKYAEAAEKYETYIKLSPATERENLMARYNAGYAYFNMQRWDKAREWFDDFLLEYETADSFRADAWNRRGDIEYYNKEFWQAIEMYDHAAKINTPEKHYSALQRANMLGLVDRADRKVESLNDIVKKGESPYVAEAMYELGRTYTGQKKYSEAAKTLEGFIAKYPTSPQYGSTLVELGLVYQNLGNNARALDYYKKAVAQESNSEVGRSAMNGIRAIYVEQNNVNAYFDYARAVGVTTDLGDIQKDSLAFVAAQRVYLSGKTTEAAAALDNYLKGYPSGTYVSNALYYAGENAAKAGAKEKALGYFTRLTGMHNNNFTIRGLERQGALAMELQRYGEAATAYDRLSRSASSDKQKNEALSSYLKAVMKGGDNATIAAAAKDVEARATDQAVVREAKYASATVSRREGRNDEATAIFAEIGDEAATAYGAEAGYRVIEAEYAKGNAERAEKLIYEYAERNISHPYWLAKAFIVLGDIYAARGDNFQARATYQSIMDGYSVQTDGIMDEVRARIDKLK